MRKYLLASLLILFPFQALAEVPSGIMGFLDGKLYNTSDSSLAYICFLDGNCYDKEMKLAFNRGAVAGVSISTPEQQAAENLKKQQEAYLAEQEKKRIANLPIQKPDVPVIPVEPTIQEPAMAKDVGEIKCSYTFENNYQEVKLSCVNSYDFTEGEVVRVYGYIPASTYRIGDYQNIFANSFIGSVPINKLCKARQLCIYTLKFDGATSGADLSSYYIKLPGEPLEKKTF